MCVRPRGIAAALLALFSLAATAVSADAGREVPVLCLAARDARAQGLTGIDAGALARYREAGFALSFSYYEEASPETLRRFPVVVGMLSQLHQGTSVFDGPFGGAVEAYMRAGGSFLFFSGPSYYGTADFDVMQNPFLARFGLELLKEVPRAAAHERQLPCSVGYRLLRTEDVTPSPYTGGAEELFLPLDYTDAYVRTHTAQFSDDWQVLATAGADAASYPHAAWLKGERHPGRWVSRPPVLAVRRVGAGRFALFTTSSEYFVWEACHPAFGEGFVLKHGGMRLMSALLGRLADGSAFGQGAVGPEQAAPASVPLPGEEVPVFTGKGAWRRYALERLMPCDHGLRSYVDCGALSDLPYSAARGRGVADAADGELIRSPGKDMYHATAANARGIGQRPVTYRFGDLDGGRSYALGLLLWSVDAGVGRDLAVEAGGVSRTFPLPALHRREGPRFVLVEGLAADASGVLDAVFTRGAGGSGSFSAVSEIWLYERGARRDADNERLFETCDALCDGAAVRFPSSRCWKGLVGARSPADGGEPVERLATAAREVGLDFLIYTDPAEAHDAASFARLRKACSAASDSGFAAVAGISFSDGYRSSALPARRSPEREGLVNAYVFQPLIALPAKNDYGNPQALFWKFFGGAFSGGKGAAPTFSQAGAGGISPWFQRFWRGFDVMAFGDGPATALDARALYADLLASGYGPQPRVSGVYRSSKDIVAARGKGWLTLSSAPSPAAVATHPHMTHASSGPEILAFQAADDFYSAYGAGGGLVFGEPEWFVLNLKVAHTGVLARVTLYANHTPVRRWLPAGSGFEVLEPVRLLTGAEYRIHAEARDGSEALSARLQAVPRAFATSMCADNQNTITTLFKAPSRFAFDERELYLQHMYWHTGEDAGQLGVMLDASTLVPRVDETGVVQPCKHFHPCPRFTFRDGSSESHQAAELRIEESSPDVARVRYSFARPGATFRSETVLTAYRPSAGGATAVFVETEIQASRSVSQEELKEITLLDVALRPEFRADWRYSVSDAEGQEFASGAFAELAGGKRAEHPFGAGCMAGAWPHAIANLFIGSCDAAEKTVAFGLGEGSIIRERMAVRLVPRGFASGERKAYRQLVMLVPGSYGAALARRHFQVRSMAPAADARLLTGTLKESGPVVRCRVGPLYSVTGTCAAADGRQDPIPLDVFGVCPQWTLAVEDASGLRLAGCGSDVLRTVLAPAAGTFRFAAGNPLVADKAGLRIEVDTLSKRRVRFLAHNPTHETIRCEVRTNPDFLSAPVFRKHILVSPGGTVWHDSLTP